MQTLGDSVQYVKGIGPKKVKLLEKLHIRTLRDALEAYPREYEDRTKITQISEIYEEEKYLIRAIVGTEPKITHIRKGMSITKLTIFDQSGTLQVTYFNNKYSAALLQIGKEYLFYGKVQGFGKAKAIISPQAERIISEKDAEGKIVPIYPLTAGIGQKDILRITDEALAVLPAEYPDPLPEILRAKYDLLDSSDAIGAIHRPKTLEEVKQARRRMVFEELFLLCCGLQRLKERRKEEKGIHFADTDLTDFYNVLPFSLTSAQKKSIEEFRKDIVSGRPMNRLLQGDVGSGKTMVAAALCILTAKNGYQAALMAPTEILAAQHAEKLASIFERLDIPCTLLTGSMSAKQKKTALEAIASGTAKVVIGTHALIQKDVVFQKLGAVVADEQHRFGVSQRAALALKGDTPHTLVMSATPIPRTLALIMYGDLDVSILDELPPGRSPVETYAVGENMRQRITKFIDKQIENGGQAYVVCPLVEDGETDLKSAEQHAETLKKALPHRNIAMLHGRMKNADKEKIMNDFAAKKYDVLVATTVIEVGVDVPGANLMVVENAERFGLSQLHQLRGRVGRGKRQSYCVFFGADKGQAAKERLKTLCKTNDGFEIARSDLAQRGPGDFFGRRQHGLPALHFADIAEDLSLMQSAREEAEEMLSQDSTLKQYPILRERVSRMFASENDEIFN